MHLLHHRVGRPLAALFFRLNYFIVIAFCVGSAPAFSLDLGIFNWNRIPTPESYQIDLAVHSINYSEPVTLKANFDDWRTDDFRDGNRIYSKHVARVGAGADGLIIGHSTNLYYFLNFSADTALLHYLDKNNRLSQHGEALDLHLNANNASGQGLYVSYTHQWQNLEFGARLNYLQLDDIMFGEAQGDFDPGKTLTNNTNLMIDYAYTEDTLFDRPVPKPRGSGMTLDVFFNFQWRQHLMQLQIAEAWSRLEWDSVAGSYIEGDLGNLQNRSDAAIRYRHFNGRFSQYLPVHTELNYRYTLLSDVALGFEYESLDRQDWQKLVATWHAPFDVRASLKWSPEDGIWGLHIQHPYVIWALETDSSDYRESRYLKLTLQGQFRW